MKFAKWVFLLAGIYGILAVAPLYFSENQIARDYPPAITHHGIFSYRSDLGDFICVSIFAHAKSAVKDASSLFGKSEAKVSA